MMEKIVLLIKEEAMDCPEAREYIDENGLEILIMIDRGEHPPHQLDEVLLHFEKCPEEKCIGVGSMFTTMMGDAKTHLLTSVPNNFFR